MLKIAMPLFWHVHEDSEKPTKDGYPASFTSCLFPLADWNDWNNKPTFPLSFLFSIFTEILRGNCQSNRKNKGSDCTAETKYKGLMDSLYGLCHLSILDHSCFVFVSTVMWVEAVYAHWSGTVLTSWVGLSEKKCKGVFAKRDDNPKLAE